MSRIMLQCAALLGGLALLAGGGRAADAPAKDAAAGNKRLFYDVKYASARDLADVLGRHFHGVAEFRPLPVDTANALLVSAAPSVFDDVVAALNQLDRPRKTVLIEVLIAEAAAPKADGDKKPDGDKPAADAPALQDKDFTGPMADVAARMEDLQKTGALANLTRVRLAAVEGRPESVLLGQNKPFTAGFNKRGGITSRTVTYRNVGSQVQATASVSADQVVTMALTIEDSRPHAPESSVPIGPDEKGKPVDAMGFCVARWEGKLSIPSGQAQAVQDVQTSSKPDGQRIILVVGAQVMEPDAKPPK
jgi:hypothetical protein